jgi:fatty acyl-CoA reductase
MKKLTDLGLEIMAESPLNNILWKPYVYITDNKMVYFWRMILVHLIPAVLVDSLLKLTRKKPM